MAEEVDDTTNCPVCFEMYTEAGDQVPRILPCSYSLCEGCLKDSISNGSVNCPQDRKKHRAASGVRSFPENKYILRNIRKEAEKKEEEEKFETCGRHGKHMMLFCNDEKCNKSICNHCLKEHSGHAIWDLKEKKKDTISTEIKSITDRLQTNRDLISKARDEVQKQYDQMISKVPSYIRA